MIRALFRPTRLAFAAGLFLTLFSLFVCAAPAKELRIEKFSSEIVVAPNGSIDVTEVITVRFIGGPWHGLYRSIPVEYVTPQQ